MKISSGKNIHFRHFTGIAGPSGVDFNPLIGNGIQSGPGIKIRINQRTFFYLSSLAKSVIEQIVPSARIPDVKERIEEVNGEVSICNIHVSHFRPPCDVLVYPAPNNLLVVKIDDFDVGVTGNLDGVVNVLLPIKLFGIVHANLYHVSITVTTALERTHTGQIYARVCGCDVNIGYADVCIECGGLVGDLVNAFARQTIAERVKNLVPARICEMLPSLVESRVNPMLARIPLYIPFSEITSSLNNILSPNIPPHCLSPICRARPSPTPPPLPTSTVARPPNNPPLPNFTNSTGFHRINAATLLKNGLHKNVVSNKIRLRPKRQIIAMVSGNAKPETFTLVQTNSNLRTPRAHRRTSMRQQKLAQGVKSWNRNIRPLTNANGERGTLCAGCPPDDGSSAIKIFVLQQLRFERLSDVSLSLAILNLYANQYGFEIDIAGEFSPRGLGGTPFGPFPMQFPTPLGGSMIEILISDFTINSLLYAMHRRGFLTIRIGPEVPGIGALLKTTCEEEDYFDEEMADRKNSSSMVLLANRIRSLVNRRFNIKRRNKRQSDSDLSSLADLGVCLGDLSPPLKENYPNRSLALNIYTGRAPSTIFSGHGEGMVSVDIILFVDIYLDGTNIRVGSISIVIILDISVRIIGNRLTGNAVFRTLQLSDRLGTLGLDQDAFNNLANLARDTLTKAINDRLRNGFPIPLPVDKIPVQINNLNIQLIERAIYISADFIVPPALLNEISL